MTVTTQQTKCCATCKWWDADNSEIFHNSAHAQCLIPLDQINIPKCLSEVQRDYMFHDDGQDCEFHETRITEHE